MGAQLRIFAEPHEQQETEPQAPCVTISLRDLLPLLTMAHRNNFLWLQDFLEDEIVVTPDFYDVLRAFQAMRPSA